MANSGAGSLIERLAFYSPMVGNPDAANDTPYRDFGNTTAKGWHEEFRCRGAITDLRGGESVMQGRLQGRHTCVIRVRAAQRLLDVQASWAIRNLGTNQLMNIRDVTPTRDRRWIDLLCESGVAN